MSSPSLMTFGLVDPFPARAARASLISCSSALEVAVSWIAVPMG